MFNQGQWQTIPSGMLPSTSIRITWSLRDSTNFIITFNLNGIPVCTLVCKIWYHGSIPGSGYNFSLEIVLINLWIACPMPFNAVYSFPSAISSSMFLLLMKSSLGTSMTLAVFLFFSSYHAVSTGKSFWPTTIFHSKEMSSPFQLPSLNYV